MTGHGKIPDENDVKKRVGKTLAQARENT